MANASATVTKAPFWFPQTFHRYIGNGQFIKKLGPYEGTNPAVKWLNSVYNLAPASKWSLSIVPMYGVFVGVPEPKNIDFNTSCALAATGAVWAFYSQIITPVSTSLCVVNVCMGSVNGYNAYRAYTYQQKMKSLSS